MSHDNKNLKKYTQNIEKLLILQINILFSIREFFGLSTSVFFASESRSLTFVLGLFKRHFRSLKLNIRVAIFLLLSPKYEESTAMSQIRLYEYMFQMWRIDPYALCIRTFNHIWNMYSYNRIWETAVMFSGKNRPSVFNCFKGFGVPGTQKNQY